MATVIFLAKVSNQKPFDQTSTLLKFLGMNENILLLDLLLQLIHALYVFLKNRLIERGVFRSNSLHSIGYLNALTRD